INPTAMKTKLLLVLLLLPFLLPAQTTLTFLDEQSKEPVPGVIVKSQKNNYLSNESGEIVLEISSPTQMVASHISYGTQAFLAVPDERQSINLQRAQIPLTEVVVSSFETERPLLEQAAAIQRIPESDLYRFNETSIVNAFNTKPGIRVEERAPASYRISIRGSSLRAPFGVRNVKVYWNDIPFTAPDGTTPLNILDLSNVENTEIIKGPAGSIYGAGNGGVINFTSRQQITNSRISSDFSFGDFGTTRFRLGVDQQLENGGISASYVQQKSDGHREHTAMDRKVFQMASTFFPSSKQTISTQILYADLHYELPGPLTAEQLADNPKQARPGSAAQNASITQKSLYGVLSHDYQFSNKISNNTSLYVNTTDFENPFNLDYKKETQYGYGGRTRFTYNDQWGQFPVRLIAGGEYQFGKTAAQNYGNKEGKADTIRFSDDLITTQAFLFQQLEVDLSESLLITLGLSENFSRFDIDRNINASTGIPSAAERRFDPVIIPRIALSAKLNSQAAVFGSVSAGFSPPTIDEVRTNEGSINLDLDAEKGINYEVGYRANHRQGRINTELNLFYFKLDETITSFTNEQGVVLFRNAGATDQKGVEAQLDYALIRKQLGVVQELKLTHAYTGHFFKFKDYQQNENDFSGNDLTGVSPHTLVNQLDLRTRAGLYLNLTHQWVDEIPLNDANTVFQDPYHLMNARLGWRNTLGVKWDLEIYGGIDNLLDESYSLGNDLNAFGGRYYQPAPMRNYYGGVKVGFRY
ncbi:MAG TPA: TonB-dependent receptor, partial [Cyclobacteriaceae bacterium]|nr:TonB-dependent receptor [Cyclobacteriaceae bacterium]